jgi:hypothetical protein
MRHAIFSQVLFLTCPVSQRQVTQCGPLALPSALRYPRAPRMQQAFLLLRPVQLALGLLHFRPPKMIGHAPILF